LAKPNAIDPKKLRRKLDKDIKYVQRGKIMADVEVAD